MKNTKTVTFNFDPELHKKLKQYSVAKEESMTEIIHRLVRKELKNVVIKNNIDGEN